jgi:hypothetical protein
MRVKGSKGERSWIGIQDGNDHAVRAMALRSEDAGGTQAFNPALCFVVDVFVWPNNNDEADGVRVEHAIDGPKGTTASDGEFQGAKAVERALEGVSSQRILLQSA